MAAKRKKASKKPNVVWSANFIEDADGETRIVIKSPEPISVLEHLVYAVLSIDAIMQTNRQMQGDTK
jgi:hypothetical protein